MASVAVEHSGANNHATSGDMKHTKGDHAHGSVPSFPISVHNINSDLLKMHYAVRGDIVTRATQIQEEIEEGRGDWPFQKLVWCNIGNPQQLGQRPVTFFRQVLCLMDYPELLNNPAIASGFPSDVVDRAQRYHNGIQSTGAYTESKGALVLRKEVALGITRRDGYPCSPNDLFLTDGATPCVHLMMKLLIRDKQDAILTPIPQYPLYSATIQLYGGTLVPYYLDEENGWGMDVNELKKSVEDAKARGLTVRALVVINPGNPTGQVLSYENQREVVEFCRKENLVLLADEVYQSNVYAEGKVFTSFKKVVRDFGSSYDDFPLVSMMSVSKGFYGECGRRGGYMEIVGLNKEVQDQVLKLASIGLCANTNGQSCMALVMNPPQPGEPSYELFQKERTEIIESLKVRSQIMVSALNKLEGVKCNDPEGAMYCFPSITLPQRVWDLAAQQNRSPEYIYCLELLESTGIVVVPGKGFQQREGTSHFRTTFLPSLEQIQSVAEKLTTFHAAFLQKYRD